MYLNGQVSALQSNRAIFASNIIWLLMVVTPPRALSRQEEAPPRPFSYNASGSTWYR
jgi:hypothetical protein